MRPVGIRGIQFDAESKSAKIPNSLYDGGGGGGQFDDIIVVTITIILRYVLIQGLFEECNSVKAQYLYQQDKFYDVTYDIGMLIGTLLRVLLRYGLYNVERAPCQRSNFRI